ncbi:MAG TPA: HEAT repeat domain-containing protein [Gemmatimonadaceae bacterium]|nr:HEAT repeat domain-containing protein [Gemmatimonadaceae bacterium]
MIKEGILDVVMAAEVGLLVVSVFLYFAHGVWLFFHQRRRERLIGEARKQLARLLTRSTVSPENVHALGRLPHGVQIAVFLEISQNITGTGKEKLRFIAGEIRLLDRAMGYCRSRSWSRRLRGTRLLARMDVSDPLVEQLLADPHPAVRAQAAEWAAAHPTVPVVAEMLDMLADPATLARFAVQDALLRMGPIVVDPLVRFLETHSGKPAESGLRLAEALAGPTFLPAGISFASSEDPALRTSAANLLGAIGNMSAASRLIEMLSDSHSDVRASAASGLGRMRHWQAASDLAKGLCDSAWAVRRDSALALRALGAPGVLLLRRALKGSDAFAADMARQTLDLPATAG